MSKHSKVPMLDTQRIVGKAELKNLILYSDTHIYRLEQEGKFPKRLKIGANRVGWLLSEVLAWIDNHKARRDAAPSAHEDGTKNTTNNNSGVLYDDRQSSTIGARRQNKLRNDESSSNVD